MTTLAGQINVSGSADGTGTSARFNYPYGVAVDSSGNVYVADTNNHMIRKITSGGVVTTIAGFAGTSGSTDGTGTSARFNYPKGVVIDGSGTLYVGDTSNHTIRKITSAGVVTTFAGLAGTTGSTNATGTAARFNGPQNIAVDSSGNVYVADANNHAVRKITPGGGVTTFAGLAGTSGSTDGTGTAARFKTPSGVAVDVSGNVYVADTGNGTIRKITSGGVGASATFYMPIGVAVDSSGNVYVGDNANHRIRKITSGVVTTLAGSAQGAVDGVGTAARFYAPNGVAVDNSGNIYVADELNQTIRKIGPGAVVTTISGVHGSAGSTDASGTSAMFNSPQGAAVDSSGNVYIADMGNHTIRKITSAGFVTTVAGTAGVSGSANGTGTAATFNSPRGIALDSSGNIYVADTGNHTIRKIDTGGAVTTFAGSPGTTGTTYATGASARFSSPRGIAMSTSGYLYVADYSNHTIRRISSGGAVTTLAGTAGSSGSLDGTGTAARFYFPRGVTTDSSGNIFVADGSNHIIRKITSGGVVTTLAGVAGSNGSVDGVGTAARLYSSESVFADSFGNIYVADTYNHTIRKISSTGAVKTVAGQVGIIGNASSFLPGLLDYPAGIAIFGKNIYITSGNSIWTFKLGW